jgi:predicted DNA-binding transcriptional regulator AlpA
MKDIVNETGLSESSIRRKLKDGAFPEPRQLIGRRRVWKPSDIEDWADGIFEEKAEKKQKQSSGFFSNFT